MTRVFIFGATGTGKTELLRQLINQEITHHSNAYKSTIGPDFQKIHGMTVWDSVGTNSKNKELSLQFRQSVSVGIYCINLSRVVDDTVLHQINLDLISFTTLNPGAELILVGTFGDQALEANTLESLRNKLPQFTFTEAFIVTTARTYGTELLLMALNRFWQRITNVQNSGDSESELNLNKLEALRDNFSEDSDLYSALNKLNNQVICLGLNADEIGVLGDEVNNLLTEISNPQLLDKTKAYDKFLANCDAKFTEKYHVLKAAVKTFAAVVLVTALAAGIFFGTGIFFGAWTGASTFFAALAEGTTGATAFSAGTCATGIISLAHYGNSFFQKPVKNAANEFIENVKNADIEDVNITL